MAELLPLFATAVDPDAEAHEDDPACPADARDERRLLYHVRNLLGKTHTALLAAVAGATLLPRHGGMFCRQFCRQEGTHLFKLRLSNTADRLEVTQLALCETC